MATQVVQIVTGLLSSPPGLFEVKTLMETALLCHDSGLTFVPHSKSNFYFLIGESFKERKRPFQKKLAQSQKATVSSGVRQAGKGEVGDGQIDNQVWTFPAPIFRSPGKNIIPQPMAKQPIPSLTHRKCVLLTVNRARGMTKRVFNIISGF